MGEEPHINGYPPMYDTAHWEPEHHSAPMQDNWHTEEPHMYDTANWEPEHHSAPMQEDWTNHDYHHEMHNMNNDYPEEFDYRTATDMERPSDAELEMFAEIMGVDATQVFALADEVGAIMMDNGVDDKNSIMEIVLATAPNYGINNEMVEMAFAHMEQHSHQV